MPVRDYKLLVFRCFVCFFLRFYVKIIFDVKCVVQIFMEPILISQVLSSIHCTVIKSNLQINHFDNLLQLVRIRKDFDF